MDKQSIRDYMKLQKEALNQLDVSRCSREVVSKVLDSREFKECDAVYTYMEYNQEIITHGIMTKAWELGKRVAVPKVINKVMDFYYIESFDDVTSGYLGILEPFLLYKAEEKKALMLMPGLAFGKDYNRVGYGGGFFDGYLSTHPDTSFFKVGLCYDFQVVDSVDREEHDYPVDMIVTPKMIYRRH